MRLAKLFFLPGGNLLTKFVRNLLPDDPERLCRVLGGDAVGAARHLLQRLDRADLLKDVGLALLLLDLRLHAEVEGRQISRLFALRHQHRDQPLQPVDALPVAVRGRGGGELGRRVALDERLDQFEGAGFLHRGLDFFVRDEGCDGETSVVLDGVVVVEGEREQPRGDFALDHGLLVFCSAVHGHVGEG